MPQVCYVNIEGPAAKSSGVNTPESMGNKYQEDHTDEITVIQFDHELMIPRDPQTGQTTGQRVHKPLCFRKRFDKASPLLYAALSGGEKLTKVEFKWYRTDMNGKQEHYFTTTLEDAVIVNIHAEMVLATDVIQDYRDHEETICMTYRKIKWEHLPGTTSGEDDWRKPPT